MNQGTGTGTAQNEGSEEQDYIEQDFTCLKGSHSLFFREGTHLDNHKRPEILMTGTTQSNQREEKGAAIGDDGDEAGDVEGDHGQGEDDQGEKEEQGLHQQDQIGGSLKAEESSCPCSLKRAH